MPALIINVDPPSVYQMIGLKKGLWLSAVVMGDGEGEISVVMPAMEAILIGESFTEKIFGESEGVGESVVLGLGEGVGEDELAVWMGRPVNWIGYSLLQVRL